MFLLEKYKKLLQRIPTFFKHLKFNQLNSNSVVNFGQPVPDCMFGVGLCIKQVYSQSGSLMKTVFEMCLEVHVIYC